MKLLILFCLIFSASVSAREIKMATIKSDVDHNTTFFLMEVDDQNTIHSIRIKTNTPSGKIIEDFSYSSQEVMNEGAVLRSERGYAAVRLEADKSFSITEGGTIVLDYLVSGVTGSRSRMQLKVIKLNSEFVLQKTTGQPVNHFFFKGNWQPIVGLVGIRDIILSYQH